ncbi:hypothetical protein IGI04_023668, partial [Brassica rapa subsp. trilocularis]
MIFQFCLMYFLLIYLFCRFLIKWYSSSTNLKEVQTTSWKLSGLHGSLLTKSPFHNRSEHFGKFLIRWYSSSTNLKVFQVWKTSGTTYLLVVWKSSGLPKSRLDF